MIFRRKTLPPDLTAPHAAFHAQVDRLEAARSALLSCLPVGRVDPAPVPVGLDLLADELDAIEAGMDGWRTPAVEQVWQECREAIGEARTHIAEARRVAEESTELEELLGAVEDVDEPLGYAFGRAERAWKDLRR